MCEAIVTINAAVSTPIVLEMQSIGKHRCGIWTEESFPKELCHLQHGWSLRQHLRLMVEPFMVCLTGVFTKPDKAQKGLRARIEGKNLSDVTLHLGYIAVRPTSRPDCFLCFVRHEPNVCLAGTANAVFEASLLASLSMLYLGLLHTY